MRRSLSTVLAVVALFLLSPPVCAQESSAAAGWDAVLRAGVAVDSTVTVVNRCHRRHRFRIDAEDLPFVGFPAGDAVQVPGGGSMVVPVRFDATDLAAGSEHNGALVVVCETCHREPGCGQDRDRFPAHFSIAGTPSTPAAPRTGGTTPETTEPPDLGLPPDVDFDYTFVDPYLWDTGAGTCNCPHCPCDGAQEGDDTTVQDEEDEEEAPGATTATDDPCDRMARACEELRRLAWDKESEAAALEAEAEAARQRAEEAERAAGEAAEAAETARQAAVGPEEADEGYVEDPEIGRIYERHFEWLREQTRQAFADWKAGRIDDDEYDRRIEALHGMDSFRRAIEAEAAERQERVRQAQQAARRAAEARGRADAAAQAAARAAEAARRARADAEAARRAYEECLERWRDCVRRQEEEQRRRQEEEAARRGEEERRQRAAEREQAEEERRADAERRAEESREAMRRRHEEERQRLEEARRQQEAASQRMAQERQRTLRERNEYLLRNIRDLGLIQSSAFWETPGIWDWLPDVLAQPVGMLVEETARVPIPTDAIKALGGLYQIAAALLDPCTAGGARKTVERLQKRTNPRTGRPYTLEEALTKTGQMCQLLRKLKAVSEQAHQAGGG